MELLNLSTHDPEEYEGKMLVWQKCEYVVGPYLGTGAERVTHKLINRASGQCLHVLKIWRQPNLGYVPSEIRARLAAARNAEFDFARIVPVSIEIDLPGGKAEMQVYIGGPRDAKTEADVLTQRGDDLLDRSDFPGAQRAYERALEKNPHHTHAMVNLAAVYAQMKDTAQAYKVAARARSIEPNYPLYHRACIQYLAAQGVARAALDEYRMSQQYFPNFFDFDDLAAELYLACGFPDKALGCAEKCLLDASAKKELVAKARAAVEAKAKTGPLIQKAGALLRDAQPPVIANVLREAHEIDPNDPVLGINFAFALARAGKPGEALPFLLRGATYGPPRLTKVCYANAAFCAIEAGKLDPAMLLLSTTMSQFDFELKGQEPKNLAVDLPGRGIWIDEEGAIIEEALGSAARLVARGVEAYQKQAPVPADALRLAKLYAKAMEK